LSRSARLLDLIQALRRRRRPVTAAVLAAELGVSARSIYRDVATLIAQGAPIEGAAGLGDEPLGVAAADSLAKIAAVLPAALRDKAEDAGLLAGPGEPVASALIDLADLRRTIRAERKLRISYVDGKGRRSERTIWPLALGFFDRLRVVAAWCEMRQDFRHFRTDRIISAEATDERYPRRRRALLAEWRKREGIAEPI
jgi:predicted DNA-binding transcriptional regulator YafY